MFDNIADLLQESGPGSLDFMNTATITDRVLKAVEDSADEAVAFTSAMIRVPTVNPPGDSYEDCARLIGDTLKQCDFAVDYLAAEGRPEHTRQHPRVNVVGLAQGAARAIRSCTSTATSTSSRPAMGGRWTRSAGR